MNRDIRGSFGDVGVAQSGTFYKYVSILYLCGIFSICSSEQLKTNKNELGKIIFFNFKINQINYYF